jgi:hypothetical protein
MRAVSGASHLWLIANSAWPDRITSGPALYTMDGDQLTDDSGRSP